MYYIPPIYGSIVRSVLRYLFGVYALVVRGVESFLLEIRRRVCTRCYVTS